MRVLSRLFRRLFLEGLEALHAAGELQFFNDLAGLEDAAAFRAHLAPLRKSEWVVYAKRPFAGPAQVLAYLARYTHRVAISNSRLIDDRRDACQLPLEGLSREWPSRRKSCAWQPASSCAGSCSTSCPMASIAFVTTGYSPMAIGRRSLRYVESCWAPWQPQRTSTTAASNDDVEAVKDPPACPCCGGRMTIIETFERGSVPRNNAFSAVRLDSS